MKTIHYDSLGLGVGEVLAPSPCRSTQLAQMWHVATTREKDLLPNWQATRVIVRYYCYQPSYHMTNAATAH
jgi:hypothetical protein